MRRERLGRLLACLDLTRLTPGDSADDVAAFCTTADTRHGTPAAVCVLPDFVDRAVATLRRSKRLAGVRVATVANFPDGDQTADAVFATIDRSLEAGADEIDLVLPWREVAEGRTDRAAGLLAGARTRCGDATLKVILETGALDPVGIERAATLALDHGADFLKTSTGVGHPGADPEAAGRLLDRIDAAGVDCGLKVSGGLRTPQAADVYLALAERRMGPAWPTPERFRIGASSLFDGLIEALDSPES